MPNVEALLKVVEILEATPDKAVDLQSWTCGTTACAIGHAANHPWFAERGLKLNRLGSPVFHQVNEEMISWDAVEEFFDLTGYAFRARSYPEKLKPSKERGDIPPSFWLFNAECYLPGEKDEGCYEFYKRQQEAGIKQQVINRIKEFVDGI